MATHISHFLTTKEIQFVFETTPSITFPLFVSTTPHTTCVEILTQSTPKTHLFIMVPSPETEQGAHSFWYAAILGIFHADVQHVGTESRDF